MHLPFIKPEIWIEKPKVEFDRWENIFYRYEQECLILKKERRITEYFLKMLNIYLHLFDKYDVSIMRGIFPAPDTCRRPGGVDRNRLFP
jgi:hypothetical protein